MLKTSHVGDDGENSDEDAEGGEVAERSEAKRQSEAEGGGKGEGERELTKSAKASGRSMASGYSPCCSHTSESSAEDENVDVRCSGADDASYLECPDSEDKRPFAVENGEDLPVEEEEGRLREEVGRGDPGELVEGVVL